MEIRLSPETEAVVERDMASGRFASREEYVAAAVESFHERGEWLGESLEEARAKLEQSLAEAERGEFATDEEVRSMWAKHGL